jgi:hypothetical protein
VSKSHCDGIPFAVIVKNGHFAEFTIDAMDNVITEIIA